MATPKISIGPVPPVTAVPGDLWYNDVTGFLFIYYDDGNTAQWVVANPGTGVQGPPGPPGPPLPPPTRPQSGDVISSFQAVVVDTTAAPVTLKLTPTPNDLDPILFEPGANSWGLPNVLTIDPQGFPINGAVDVLVCDVPVAFWMRFQTGYGWTVFPLKGGPGPAGPPGPAGANLKSPTYVPVFAGGIYGMVPADLGKTFKVDTGSGADLVINLVDPAPAALGFDGDGQGVAFYKNDAGTAVLIIKNSDGTDNTHLMTQGDFIRLRINNNVWVASDTRISPVMRIYTANDTWKKRPRLSWVRIFGIGGGGGGGSGRQGAVNTARAGGLGGGVGLVLDRAYTAALIPGDLSVTVGADAPGGAFINAADTNGNPGNGGNDSMVSNWFRPRGGGAGGGGTATAASGGVSQTATDRTPVNNGGGNSITANSVAPSNNGGPGAGGAGGGISTGNAVFNGAAGGQGSLAAFTGSSAGSAGSAGGNGGNGGDGDTLNKEAGGGGGGGGGASITAAAGAGGNGGFPGGAGGGGGASLNGFNSGPGGIGRRGEVRFTEHYER